LALAAVLTGVAVTPAATQSVNKAPRVLLVQVLLGGRQALVLDRVTGEFQVVKVGDDLQGFRVTEIDPDQIVLATPTGPDRSFVLPLVEEAARGSRPGGGDGTQSPNAAPITGSPSPGAANSLPGAAPEGPDVVDPYGGVPDGSSNESSVLDPYGASPSGSIPSVIAPPGSRAEPAPTLGDSPAPTAGSPAPTAGSPAPTAGAPAPTVGSPAPTVGSPAPTAGAPAPTVGSPAPTAGSSAPMVGSPAPAVPAPSGPGAGPSVDGDVDVDGEGLSATGDDSLGLVDSVSGGAGLAPVPPATTAPSASARGSRSPSSAGKVTVVEPTEVRAGGRSGAENRKPEQSRKLSRRELDAALADFSALARQMNIEPVEGGGIRVVEIERGSFVARLGIERGDVIKRVAGHSIDTVDEAAAAYAALARAKQVLVELERGGAPLRLRFQLVR
jgi:hypothetical protein